MTTVIDRLLVIPYYAGAFVIWHIFNTSAAAIIVLGDSHAAQTGTRYVGCWNGCSRLAFGDDAGTISCRYHVKIAGLADAGDRGLSYALI